MYDLSALSSLGFCGALEFGAPLARYTTFRIGGPAAALLHAACEEDIVTSLAWAKENAVPCLVVGNGSNLLAPDAGYDGLIVHLGRDFGRIDIAGCTLTAQAGVLLSSLAAAAAKAGLTGLEFAQGIPGSLGGALMMNAGAYGGEMSQVVTSARVLENGRIVEYANEQLDFSYRHSALKDKQAIALSATVTLTPGDRDTIKATMAELRAKRTASQPLDLPSAGSTFKRPVGGYAARLIDECGLKGARIGGAQVSEKHAGFIVNTGGATYEDVLSLMRHVRRVVLEKTGIELENEVILLGGETL